MYIDPALMTDGDLISEIEATKEELDLFSGITTSQALRMDFDPRVSVEEIQDRLEMLMQEGCKRGLYRPNFKLV